MTPFHRSALARAGLAALLAAGGLAAVAAPAQAAGKAQLALTPLSYQVAKGVKAAKAKPFKFRVDNLTESVDATAVTVTVDTSGLDRSLVRVVVPDGCDKKGKTFTCLLGDLPGGTAEDFAVPVFSTGGPGDAGTLSVKIKAANAEPVKKLLHDIAVTASGYDLTAWVQDLQANVVVNGAVADEPDLKPVRRGVTVPLDWAVFNGGSRKATGVTYGLTLPAGVSFVRTPEGCVAQEFEGRNQIFCDDLGVIVKPGEYYTADVRLKVDDDVTGPVLKGGDLFAYGLARAEGPVEEEPEVATQAQRRAFTEADPGDNQTTFEAFVDLSAEPTPTPTPTPGGTATPSPGATAAPGGGGGDGSLPVTGVQAGLIGGVGALVLLAGGALLLLARRRRVVLVTPGDERSTD